MSGLLRLGPLAIYHERHNLWVCVGPYACRYTWPWTPGGFGNGSRWRSGWHRTDQQPDC